MAMLTDAQRARLVWLRAQIEAQIEILTDDEFGDEELINLLNFIDQFLHQIQVDPPKETP
jgi:hypothetical protein